MDNRQADHQASVIKMEGIIHNQPISILIDLGSSFSCISPMIFEKYALQITTHDRSHLFQLAKRNKKWVEHIVKSCPDVIGNMPTNENLNLI